MFILFTYTGQKTNNCQDFIQISNAVNEEA